MEEKLSTHIMHPLLTTLIKRLIIRTNCSIEQGIYIYKEMCISEIKRRIIQIKCTTRISTDLAYPLASDVTSYFVSAAMVEPKTRPELVLLI